MIHETKSLEIENDDLESFYTLSIEAFRWLLIYTYIASDKNGINLENSKLKKLNKSKSKQKLS